MLFKQEILGKIASGEVTLAFRRSRRPTVKAGGRLRTPVGELAIQSLDITSVAEISSDDVRRTGYPTLPALLTSLSGPDGEIYRIEFRTGVLPYATRTSSTTRNLLSFWKSWLASIGSATNGRAACSKRSSATRGAARLTLLQLRELKLFVSSGGFAS